MEEPLLPASRFRVIIGGDVVGVCRVHGLALVEGEAEGAATVRIERALSSSRLLFDWRRAVHEGEDDRRDMRVEQLDATGEHVVLGFLLSRARPVAWHAPSWDSRAGGVAIEALELTYDRLSWISGEGDAS